MALTAVPCRRSLSTKIHKVVEVAASYQVCSGGLETRRGFVRIDEDGFDIGDLTSSDNSSGN